MKNIFFPNRNIWSFLALVLFSLFLGNFGWGFSGQPKSAERNSWTLQWLKKLASESEIVSEPWLPFLVAMNITPEGKQLRDRAKRYFGGKRTDLEFLLDALIYEDFDTKAVDLETIEKLIARKTPVTNIPPKNLPKDFISWWEDPTSIGGSRGHEKHDTLIVLKHALIHSLYKSKDGRFLDSVVSEFYNIQKTIGFCGDPTCYVMSPFIDYANHFCSNCKTFMENICHCSNCKDNENPFRMWSNSLCGDARFVCPRCKCSFRPILYKEKTHIRWKKK